MKFLDYLDFAAEKNNSLLCVGLDIDFSRIPKEILDSEDPIFNFNRAIVDATCDLVCAYKPNIAFYEMYGIYGLESLMKTIEYVREKIPVILDAKRGDVRHTAMAYAKAVFDVYKADAVTVNPYMGYDTIKPFMEYQEKGVFILCLTSNVGYKDFQTAGKEEPLYKLVAKHAKEWNLYKNLGLVVGATQAQDLKDIREITGDMPILIPGIGAQGGDVEDSVKFGTDKKGGRAIFNASRSVIYASSGRDFASAARQEAQRLRDKINQFREGKSRYVIH